MRWITKEEAREFARKHYGLDKSDGAITVSLVLETIAVALGFVLLCWVCK